MEIFVQVIIKCIH